jgi:hypothetical protein
MFFGRKMSTVEKAGLPRSPLLLTILVSVRRTCLTSSSCAHSHWVQLVIRTPHESSRFRVLINENTLFQEVSNRCRKAAESLQNLTSNFIIHHHLALVDVTGHCDHGAL